MISLKSNSSSTGSPSAPASLAAAEPPSPAAGKAGSCCSGAVRTLPDSRPSSQSLMESCGRDTEQGEG